MPGNTFTLADLCRILTEVAGTEQGVDLDGDILDTPFEDLGYDSLALLETSARIGQEFGRVLSDDAVVEALTPRIMLDLVNRVDVPA
jgi:act minimal PKS acyl carrier protein